MNFKQWLNEVSYTPKDIPKWFFVGIYFNYKNLLDRQLKGIKGITEDLMTAYEMGEAVLAMPGPETERINSLSRVLYDNPEYMASKNWEAAERVKGGNLGVISIIIHQIMVGLQELLPETPILDAAHEITMGFPKTKKLHHFLKEFWKRLHYYISPGDISWDVLKNLVIEKVNSYLTGYSAEKEWRVKNEILNVPKDSYLAFDMTWEDPNVDEKLKEQYKVVNMEDIRNLVPKQKVFSFA
jgi:hypothetical protein